MYYTTEKVREGAVAGVDSGNALVILVAGTDGYQTSVTDGEARILSLMADGSQRTLDAIRVSVRLGPSRLRGDLGALVDDGLLKRNAAGGKERFVIMVKGVDLNRRPFIEGQSVLPDVNTR